MTTGDKLRVAAARVRAGWCQCNYREREGRVCALGALVPADVSAVVRTLYASRAEVHSLVRAIGASPQTSDLDNLMTVWHWNDAEGQTAENVAAGLEYAALLADQEDAHVQALPVSSPRPPVRAL